MDFHAMKRKELQALCKKHNIPANLKNLEMANRLASLFKIDDEKPKEQLVKPCLKNLEDLCVVDDEMDEGKEPKKVRFSPQSQMFVFEKTDPRAMRVAARRRNSMAIVEDKISKEEVVSALEDGREKRKGKTTVTRSTRQQKRDRGVDETISAAEDAPIGDQCRTRRSARVAMKRSKVEGQMNDKKSVAKGKSRVTCNGRQKRGRGVNETVTATEDASIADQYLQKRTHVLNDKKLGVKGQEKGVSLRNKQPKDEQSRCVGKRKLSSMKHVEDLHTDSLAKSVDSVDNSEVGGLVNSFCEVVDVQNTPHNDSSVDKDNQGKSQQLHQTKSPTHLLDECNSEKAVEGSCEASILMKELTDEKDMLNKESSSEKVVLMANSAECEHMLTRFSIDAILADQNLEKAGNKGVYIQEAAETTITTMADYISERIVSLIGDSKDGTPDCERSHKQGFEEASNSQLSSGEESFGIETLFQSEYVEDERNVIGASDVKLEEKTSSQSADIVLSPSSGLKTSPYRAISVSRSCSEGRKTELANSASKFNSWIQSASPLKCTSIEKLGISVPMCKLGSQGTYHHETATPNSMIVECDPHNEEVSSIKNSESEDKFITATISSNEQGQLTWTSSIVDSATPKENQSGDVSFIFREGGINPDLCNLLKHEPVIERIERSDGVDNYISAINHMHGVEEITNSQTIHEDANGIAAEKDSVVIGNDNHENADLEDQNMEVCFHEEKAGRLEECYQDADGVTLTASEECPAESEINHKQEVLEEETNSQSSHEETNGIAAEKDNVVISNIHQESHMIDAELIEYPEDLVKADQDLKDQEEKAGNIVGYIQEAEEAPTPMIGQKSECSHSPGDTTRCEKSHKQGHEAANFSQLSSGEELYGIATLFESEYAEDDNSMIDDELKGEKLFEAFDVEFDNNFKDEDLADENMDVSEEKGRLEECYQDADGVTPTASDECPAEKEINHKQDVLEEETNSQSSHEETNGIAAEKDNVVISNIHEERNMIDAELIEYPEDLVKADQDLKDQEDKAGNIVGYIQEAEEAPTAMIGQKSECSHSPGDTTRFEKSHKQGHEAANFSQLSSGEVSYGFATLFESEYAEDDNGMIDDELKGDKLFEGFDVEFDNNFKDEDLADENMDVSEEKGDTCRETHGVSERQGDVCHSINREEFGSNSQNKPAIVLQGSEEKLIIQSSVDGEKTSDENGTLAESRAMVELFGPSPGRTELEEDFIGLAVLERISEQTEQQSGNENFSFTQEAENSDGENFSLTPEAIGADSEPERLPHPEASVTKMDDQSKSAYVKGICKQDQISSQLEMNPLNDEAYKVENSSLKPNSMMDQNKRSILIHGTLRKPIRTTDMKENTLHLKRELNLGDATAFRPMAKRRALEELHRK